MCIHFIFCVGCNGKDEIAPFWTISIVPGKISLWDAIQERNLTSYLAWFCINVLERKIKIQIYVFIMEFLEVAGVFGGFFMLLCFYLFCLILFFHYSFFFWYLIQFRLIMNDFKKKFDRMIFGYLFLAFYLMMQWWRTKNEYAFPALCQFIFGL